MTSARAPRGRRIEVGPPCFPPKSCRTSGKSAGGRHGGRWPKRTLLHTFSPLKKASEALYHVLAASGQRASGDFADLESLWCTPASALRAHLVVIVQ
jgi:hypothetical protein